MVNTLAELKNNPRYQSLSVGAQFLVAKRKLDEDLALDPSYQTLSPVAQKMVKDRLLTEAPTFSNPETEARLKDLGRKYLSGDAILEKQARDFGNSFMQNSGAIGLVANFLTPEDDVSDRKRAVDYYRNLDLVTGRSDWSSEAGAVLGTVADIVAVSAVMSPAVGAASRGIGLAARGGAEVAAKAAALGVEAAITRPILAKLGPIAAESAIEAIPYFLTSEQVAKQQGRPTVLSQGAGEVARTLGINAAADFFVGSVLTASLSAAAKTGKILFGARKLSGDVPMNSEQLDVLSRQLETGTYDASILDQLDPIDRAKVFQQARITAFVRDGIGDPEMDQLGRSSLAAHDLGMILEKTPDGSPNPWRLWELSKTGKPASRIYNNLTDAENYISFKFFKGLEATKPEDMAKFLRPENAWAFNRGKLLVEQQSWLSTSAIDDTDVAFKKSLPESQQDPGRRIAVSNGEAQAIIPSTPDQVVVRTKVPLRGSIVEAANSGDLDLMKGTSAFRAKDSVEPNALLIGVKGAPEEVYQAATLRAEELIQKEPWRTLDDARANLLLNQGFDHFKLPDGEVEFFTARNMKLIGTPEQLKPKTLKPIAPGVAASKLIIEEGRKVTLSAKLSVENESALLRGTIKAANSGNPEDIMNVSKLYLGDGTSVKVLYGETGSQVNVTRGDDGLVVVQVPKSIRSFGEQKAYINDLFAGLNKIDTSTPALHRSGDYYSSLLSRDAAKFGFPGDINPVPWLESTAESVGGKFFKEGDQFILQLSDGVRPFSKLQDAVDYLGRKVADEGSIKIELGRQGYKIIQKADGTFITKGHGKSVEGATIHEVADKLNFIPGTVDRRFGPSDVEITPEGFVFTIANKRFPHSLESATAMMAKFSDTSSFSKLKFLSSAPDGDLAQTFTGRYRVSLPRYGAVEEFASIADAQKFLHEKMPSFEKLGEMANKRGLHFSVEKGQYVLEFNGTKMLASTPDELEAIYKRFPDLSESMQPLVKLDPSIEVEIPELIKTFKGNTYRAGKNPYNQAPEFAVETNIKDMSSWMNMRALTSEFYTWLSDAARRTGFTWLGTFGNDVKLATRRMNLDQQTATKYLHQAFMDPSGKILSAESRKRIFYSAGAQEGTNQAESLKKMFSGRYGKSLENLTPAEEAAKAKLVEFYDDLSRKFGIDYKKFVFDYMPRIKEAYGALEDSAKKNLFEAKDLVELVPDWAQGRAPREVKFWAENERLDELPRFWLKDDALEVALLYSTQGHKKLYLNPVWKKYFRYMEEQKNAGNQVPAPLIERISNFRMDMMGSRQTPGEKVVAAFGSAFFKEVKRSRLGKLLPFSETEMEAAGHDLFKNVLATSYLASMGWKPFLAIRNTLQIYSTLAPRFGLDWTTKASKEVLKNPKATFEKLRALGILSEKPPIVNAVYGSDSFLGKVSDNAFNWFKNSDDLSRAVAYTAGEMRFRNAVNAMRLGQIKSKDEFLSLSGLSRIDPVSSEDIFRIVDGKFDDARSVSAGADKFANKVQTETMFDYSGSSSPLMTRGIPGIAWGQYGTFSAAYRGHLAAMVKFGSKKEILGSIATYLALGAGITAGFNALNIKTNDFMPVTPGIFTGGPMFDIGLNAIKAFDTGFEGNQARAGLARDLPSLIPFGAQAKGISAAAEYASDGDPYRAILKATMVPLVDR